MAGVGVEYIPLRFLDFPQEIRTKIYSELLLGEKVFSRSINRYRLRPNILRVNRQICEEAYEILYKANQWIYIQEEERSLKQALVQLCIPFMVVQKGSRYFYEDPAMVLRLRCPATPTKTPKKRFECSYLVTADRLQDVCLALRIAKQKAPKRTAAAYVRISISFHKQCRDNRRLQDKLSHCLRYLPYFKEADVTGVNPAPLRLGIIHDITRETLPTESESEAGLELLEREGDLCLQATMARGAKAKANKALNSTLARIKYNRALAGTMALLDQSTSAAAAPIPPSNNHPSKISTISNTQLLPLITKLSSTAAAYSTKENDNETLTTRNLLSSLLRSPHLPSIGTAKVFTWIAEVARGRSDYNLSVSALLQARNLIPDDEQQQELKKPVVRLWKSLVKGNDDGDGKIRAYLLVLRRRFAVWVADLEMPDWSREYMVIGDEDTEGFVGVHEREVMREAEQRMMRMGGTV
ncbi:MAG: hypothetical protein Q9168_002841 [Polycauliona sp. 1 TL-2023]